MEKCKVRREMRGVGERKRKGGEGEVSKRWEKVMRELDEEREGEN